MSEEVLQQLVKMVATNNRQQMEVKEQLTQMKETLNKVEKDISDIKGNLYRMERMDRQLNKVISRTDRLEVEMEMEMLQQP